MLLHILGDFLVLFQGLAIPTACNTADCQSRAGLMTKQLPQLSYIMLCSKASCMWGALTSTCADLVQE